MRIEGKGEKGAKVRIVDIKRKETTEGKEKKGKFRKKRRMERRWE